MELAHIYFAVMVLLMLPLAAVHAICRGIVKRYPEIMPDEKQRQWYRHSEYMMGLTCLAMLWYMWAILPWMVTFCATDILAGFLAHAPWIAGTGAVLGVKCAHLKRLMDQVRAL